MEPKNTAQPVPETFAQAMRRMNWVGGKRFLCQTEDRYFAGQIPSPKQEVTAKDLEMLAEMFRTRDPRPQ